MNHLQTTGIILSRTNYGEADRILTLLTPDYGKLRVLARGVRKVKSKLAGGIELFSVSHISFIRGRSELGTLVSTRLIKHYGHIAEDLARTQTGYELIKLLNRSTEDEPEAEYFELMYQAFAALDNKDIDLDLIRTWFAMQLLRQAGHSPNLSTDTNGDKLAVDKMYNFDFDSMAFTPAPHGRFGANHIKLLRLGFGNQSPKSLSKVEGIDNLSQKISILVQTMFKNHIMV